MKVESGTIAEAMIALILSKAVLRVYAVDFWSESTDKSPNMQN